MQMKEVYDNQILQQQLDRRQYQNIQMQIIDDKKHCEAKLKTSKLTFKQSLMGACTNIIFKLGAIGGIKKAILQSPDSNFVILGQLIWNKADAKEKLQNIIWFTYRQKLKIAQDLNSDVGWGCLPRVGQMVLAQAIVTHYKSKGKKIGKSQYKKIIYPFLDDTYQSSGYSLSRILKYARLKFALNPGQWFNIGQLSEVLRKIQDEKPLEGTEDMKVIFFNQSVIFLNHIKQKAKVAQCKCIKKVKFCNECNKKMHELKNTIQNFQKDKSQIILTIFQYDSGENKIEQNEQITEIKEKNQSLPKVGLIGKGWEIYDDTNQIEWNQLENKEQNKNNKDAGSTQRKQCCGLENHLLLIVSVRICQKVIDKFDFNAILSLLSLNTSLGIIGGVPSKALYIVGHQGNQLIYLDPHYVQDHLDNQNFQSHLNTFFCNQYRTLSMQSLDPSMAFCFYLKTIEELDTLFEKIEQLKESYQKAGKSFFISVMDNDKFDDQCEVDHNHVDECPENIFKNSFEYNSLQFRDIGDSL